MSRATLRGNLEQDVLAQVKVFSDWKQQEGKVYNLEEMETQALAVAKEVARALLSYGVADERQVEQQQRPEVEPKCPECGKGMRYGGQRGKTVGSKAGEVSYQRGYYHCPACGAGLFPPGPAVGSGRAEVEHGATTAGDVAGGSTGFV